MGAGAHEVLHRHVRLPREPGGLAAPGGRAARPRRRARLERHGGSRHRQQLLGDGVGRPGRAADRPPPGARQSRGAHRGDRLLRHAVGPARSPRFPTCCASCPTTHKDGLAADLAGDARPHDGGALWRGRGLVRRARLRSPAWRGARPTRCASRPAATRAAPTASSRRRAGAPGACRSRRCSTRWTGPRPRASRRSRSPACTWAATAATCRPPPRCSRCSPPSTRGPAACGSASARSSRWTACPPSSTSSRPATASTRISICPCSTRATGCSPRCGGRTRWTPTAAPSIACASACRTRRSGPTSSWAFRARPTRTSRPASATCPRRP